MARPADDTTALRIYARLGSETPGPVTFAVFRTPA